MALKSLRSFLIFCFITILSSTLFPATDAYALTAHSSGAGLPALGTFVEQVENGEADELRGIYIPEMLAAPVVQQPAGMDGFVSPWQNVVTQFNMASKLGSTGFLAHNDLAGKSFALLQKDQEIYLVRGDGSISTFIVTEILQYQAAEPNNVSSSFVNMANGNVLTSAELFTKAYSRPGQVVLQTCIDSRNDLTWGRLFIIAAPRAQ